MDRRPLTIGILGGSGQTGKHALLGALRRGHKVRALARNVKKVEGMVTDDKLKKNFTPVKQDPAGFVEDNFVELFEGCDCVLCFLGCVKKGDNVVLPATQVGCVENGENTVVLLAMQVGFFHVV